MNRKKTAATAERRQVLRLLGGGLSAVWGLSVACSTPAGDAGPTRVAISAIPKEGRLRVLDGENPVELRHTATGAIAARSLWCTHFGCEVEWSPEREQYLCPCHEGIFDQAGRPLSGPPPRPLAQVSLRREGDEVVIEGAPAASAESGESPA